MNIKRPNHSTSFVIASRAATRQSMARSMLYCALAFGAALPALAADDELDALSSGKRAGSQTRGHAAAPSCLSKAPWAAPASATRRRAATSGAPRLISRIRAGWRPACARCCLTGLTISTRTFRADDDAVNSLREAYLSWQPEAGNTVAGVGPHQPALRPGLRLQPDRLFPDGSLRVLTTADPFALRENRLGTVMLRGQYLWTDGALSLALSPKLEDNPSSDGWNLDLGATNNRDRYLLALSTQFSQRVSSQALLYQEERQLGHAGPQHDRVAVGCRHRAHGVHPWQRAQLVQPRLVDANPQKTSHATALWAA